MIESVEQFAALVENGSGDALATIRHGEASEEIWLQIIYSAPELVRAVTLNKQLPDSILRRLAMHVDAEVRSDIANKRGLPSDVFEILAADEDESVRARLAWNRKTPRAILQRLANDEELIVSEPARARIGSN